MKELLNRSTFGKVIVKIKVAPFFMAHGVHASQKNWNHYSWQLREFSLAWYPICHIDPQLGLQNAQGLLTYLLTSGAFQIKLLLITVKYSRLRWIRLASERRRTQVAENLRYAQNGPPFSRTHAFNRTRHFLVEGCCKHYKWSYVVNILIDARVVDCLLARLLVGDLVCRSVGRSNKLYENDTKSIQE